VSTLLVRLLSLALCVSLILALAAPGAAAAQAPQPAAPQTLEELQQQLRAVLQQTGAPGASVALVAKGEILWAGGLGTADVAAGIPADANTRFRIGSISKMFVALSVLKLVEQGRLHLDDRVRDLAPDVEFTNPWESSDPVRLVHLLEHTSGFDDIALREYALDDPDITLHDGLAFNPKSRTVRWRPGDFFSYSNSGPAVAAYVVEKVTGQRYEDYVQAQFFGPLDMNSAGYFQPDRSAPLARSYAPDGRTEMPFSHILVRPSGAISLQPLDMGHLLQFLLNRGSYAGKALLTPQSIERMETPVASLAARAGLKAGYGLNNMSMPAGGFAWHGHGGGIDGFGAMLAYVPEAGVGYYYSVNASNGAAVDEFGKLIRAFLTRDITPPAPAASASTPAAELEGLAGYYESFTPRQEALRFQENLTSLVRVDVQGDHLTVAPMLGPAIATLSPVGGRQFRGEDDPVATAIFVPSAEAGWYMLNQGDLPSNFRSVPAWQAWLRTVLSSGIVLIMLSAIVFAPVWIVRLLLGRLRGAKHLSVRALPLLAVVMLLITLVVFVTAMSNVAHLGVMSAWSLSITALTILFPLASAAGLVQAVRSFRWSGVNRAVRVHSLLVSLANVAAAAYLAAYGWVGVRTWM